MYQESTSKNFKKLFLVLTLTRDLFSHSQLFSASPAVAGHRVSDYCNSDGAPTSTCSSPRGCY